MNPGPGGAGIEVRVQPSAHTDACGAHRCVLTVATPVASDLSFLSV